MRRDLTRVHVPHNHHDPAEYCDTALSIVLS